MHAADPGTVQYVAVGDTVLPGDVEDTLEAPHVEGVEAALLAHVCGTFQLAKRSAGYFLVFCCLPGAVLPSACCT